MNHLVIDVLLIAVGITLFTQLYVPDPGSNAQPNAEHVKDYSQYVSSIREEACQSSTLFYDKNHPCFNYIAPNAENCKIGIGVASDVDFRVAAEDLFKVLSPPDKAIHVPQMTTLEEIRETLAYHFSMGAAGEYTIEDPNLFEQFLDTIKHLNPEKRYIAGTGWTMAKRVSSEGCQTLLTIPLIKEQADLVPQKDILLNEIESKYDIHIVVEYPEGLSWGNHVSPRYNRFYLNHDLVIQNLEFLDTVNVEELRNADIYALGGTQLLQSFKGYRTTIDRIKRFLERANMKHVHFEFANFYDKEFFDYFYAETFGFYDSLGINEQEIDNLIQYIRTGELTHLSDSKPTLTNSVFAINDLLKLMKGQLSRLHFHSLFVHAICSNKDWETPTIAVANSVLIASMKACLSTDIQSTDILIQDEPFKIFPDSEQVSFTKEKPIVEWNYGDYQCAISPVPVCRHPKETAGIGDNISGMGLAYHRLRK